MTLNYKLRMNHEHLSKMSVAFIRQFLSWLKAGITLSYSHIMRRICTEWQEFIFGAMPSSNVLTQTWNGFKLPKDWCYGTLRGDTRLHPHQVANPVRHYYNWPAQSRYTVRSKQDPTYAKSFNCFFITRINLHHVCKLSWRTKRIEEHNIDKAYNADHVWPGMNHKMIKLPH